MERESVMRLEDYLSDNPHRDWVLKYLAESLWYPGDLSLVRKVTSAVWEELSSIGSLYHAEVEREGWGDIENRLVFYWRQGLSRYKDPDEVVWGEISGLNPQVLRVIKGIFPHVIHYSCPSAAAIKTVRPEPLLAAPHLDLLEETVTSRSGASWKTIAAGAVIVVLILALYFAFSGGLLTIHVLNYAAPPPAPDTAPPTILYVSPPDGSQAMNPVSIIARYSDDSLNLSSIRLFLNGTEIVPTRIIPTEVGYSADLPLGSCEVRLILGDLSGNTADAAWTFTVSSTLQAVTSSVIEEINAAREELGIPPVTASPEYVAAGYRAQDMLANGYFNHYDLAGKLPDLHYTSFGGVYTIEENIGYVYSPGLDTAKLISSSRGLVNDMIFDDAASGWGHRDSLLDPTNNYAEVGIAWNDSRLFLVVHMVKSWVNWTDPPRISNGTLSCAGKILLEDSELKSVLIYYSNPGDHDTFTYDPYLRILEGEHVYSLGSPVSGVAPPPLYYPGLHTIRPKEWQSSGASFSVSFETTGLASTSGPGVYTVVFYAENTLSIGHPYSPTMNWSELPILEYSFFLG